MSFLFILFVFVSISYSNGISVDAGLTPAEDRWIFRTQFRYLSLGSMAMGHKKMEMYTVPVVIAYGLKSNLSLLCRLPVMRRNISIMDASSAESGFGDLFIMGKFKVFRQNHVNYTLGLAATLGIEVPTGSDGFSSDSWDLQPGLYFSWRRGSLGSDVSMTYTLNDFADRGQNNMNPGNELTLDWAVSYQFGLGERSMISIAPVIEVSYRDLSPDRLNLRDIENSGESLLFLSPGMKFTLSSLILEILVQIPVVQNWNGIQLERNATWLFGMRYMF